MVFTNMGLKRTLPDSDIKRLIALTTAKEKKDNTLPENIVLFAKTIERLDSIQPLFHSKIQERASALAAQAKATNLKYAAMTKSKMNISHFIQAFNNGVDRGAFLAVHRGFYNLDINSKSVPSLTKESDIIFWGENLINGDSSRIASGGAPMSNPTIAEVQADYNNFLNLDAQQSEFKDAYDNSQEAVGVMRKEVDSLILRIWDEVEAAFNDQPIESKRRHARLWGVVYTSKKKTIITGTVTDAATNRLIKSVGVSLVESGEFKKTNKKGFYKLRTNFAGTATLEFSIADYVTKKISISIPESCEVVQDVALLKL